MMAEKDGVAQLDVFELTAEQQEKLLQFKLKTRFDNQKYLRSHPEVDELIGDFIRGANVHVKVLGDVLCKRPADIHEFAAEYFSNPNLHETILLKMEGNSDTN